VSNFLPVVDWVKSGSVTGPGESPLSQGKRTWAVEENLKTKLQTNCAARHNTSHNQMGWSQLKCQTSAEEAAKLLGE
jgi:hypothetical protein